MTSEGSVMRSDPELGWVPVVPEPFWHRSWRTLFRWRPQCTICHSMPIFKTRSEYDCHYVLFHIEPWKD